MTMAGAQVFEALHGETPADMSTAYPEVFANWVTSSALDLPSEGDLLTDKGIPFSKWAGWVAKGLVVLGILGCAVGAGILGSNGNRAWRWLAWSGGTLMSISLDWFLFYAVAAAIQNVFRTSQHVIYYVSGARQPGARVVATLSSLCIFVGLFAPFNHVTTIVLNILICTVISTVGFLSAHVATKMLAVHFHRRGFFDRLQQALQEEYYLMALSKPRGKRMRRRSWTEDMYLKASKKKPKPKIADTKLVLDDPKLLLSLEAVERHIHHNRLRLVFDKCSPVEDEGAAKQLAFYIFWNVMEDKQREHLTRSDIAHFLPEKDVGGAFKLLDCDGDGKPTWTECRDAVVRIFKQRKQLTDALHDTGSIVGTLHVILVVVSQIILIFLYLLVWRVDVARVWVTFSSIILAFTFMLGNSIRTAYENMIFLFVVHPFDVGDILLVDGESHVVYKMKLANTILEQSSGIRVSYPNNRLAQLPICNQSRAECVRETYAFAADLNTPQATFADVKAAAETYISHHPKDFQGECTCITTATLDPLKLRLCINVTYSFNHSQGARLNEVRHGLILVITNSLVQKGVAYTDPQNTSAPLLEKNKAPDPLKTDNAVDNDDDDDDDDPDAGQADDDRQRGA